MDKFKPISKAIAGGLVGALTALGTALIDGAVTPAEWVSVALAAIIGSGIVYAAPANTDRP